MTKILWEIPRRPDAALSRSKHGLCRSGLVREDVGTGDIFRASDIAFADESAPTVDFRRLKSSVKSTN